MSLQLVQLLRESLAAVAQPHEGHNVCDLLVDLPQSPRALVLLDSEVHELVAVRLHRLPNGRIEGVVVAGQLAHAFNDDALEKLGRHGAALAVHLAVVIAGATVVESALAPGSRVVRLHQGPAGTTEGQALEKENVVPRAPVCGLARPNGVFVEVGIDPIPNGPINGGLVAALEGLALKPDHADVVLISEDVGNDALAERAAAVVYAAAGAIGLRPVAIAIQEAGDLADRPQLEVLGEDQSDQLCFLCVRLRNPLVLRIQIISQDVSSISKALFRTPLHLLTGTFRRALPLHLGEVHADPGERPTFGRRVVIASIDGNEPDVGPREGVDKPVVVAD